MEFVFLLEHLHIHEDGEECWKRIGVYKTYQDAVDAVTRSRVLPGFATYPDLIDASKKLTNGFLIEKYPLNTDHWESGFITG
jgi:hypothetical protein